MGSNTLGLSGTILTMWVGLVNRITSISKATPKSVVLDNSHKILFDFSELTFCPPARVNNERDVPVSMDITQKEGMQLSYELYVVPRLTSRGHLTKTVSPVTRDK